MLWEVIKGRIRDESIKFSSKLKKEQNLEEKRVEINIKTLEHDITINPNDEEILQKLKQEKTKFDSIQENKIKGILLRARAEWIEGAEKNTKYFSNLEKKRAEEKSIKQLFVDDKLITEQKHIMSSTAKFYEQLYKKDNFISNNDTFFETNGHTITNEQKQHCEGEISEYEAFTALKEMNNNKSPGSDGISADFF